MSGPEQTSMFSLEGPLANHSASQDYEADWLTRVATSRLGFLEFLRDFSPAGSSGKTSPAHFRRCPTSLPIHVERQSSYELDMETGGESLTHTTQTKTMRSPACWPDFQNSGMGGPTGFLTLNTSEYPSDAVVSSLSDILEAPGSVPQQYYLSATACSGILRRAEKRGRKLPDRLRSALEVGAESMAETDDTTNS